MSFPDLPYSPVQDVPACPSLSGSINFMFSVAECLADDDLSEQHSHLSFRVLRSDESFVP